MLHALDMPGLLVKVSFWSALDRQQACSHAYACIHLLCEAGASMFNAASSSNTEEQQAVEDAGPT